ncbi:DUF3146 family protein [Synechococcus sp. CS-1325]|uniref:DUF3146 family protein n=1 Tax=unclassified Synechococcus TaxID=2626047 RepID=UPI000DB38633|nr:MULTISPECIES: DUF3146 family protein [unclassified Synechococcus]MCT0200195.1 DUF3146 family protein [Synechococcus sp. CS-1325]MCT0212737.1 DUF3146 family protein [Synechococcus sp. CS-1326]MCT0233745.1 DUF3146 family protein [Synechococcus sp. CS-1327]PZU96954.1 MAG: DUF3146 domain-containing protein [Cyanobium sp.]
MSRLPATTAQLRVLHQSFSQKLLEGEVVAGGFQWTFRWAFDRGELSVEPSLGRALIQDALLRFLLKADYQLEPGSDYAFTVRAKF